eukprot:scaffold644_cov357-Pavlova_lutheri.AAC.4
MPIYLLEIFGYRSLAHCPMYRTIGDNSICRAFATLTMRDSFAPHRTSIKILEGPKSKRMCGETPRVVV